MRLTAHRRAESGAHTQVGGWQAVVAAVGGAVPAQLQRWIRPALGAEALGPQGDRSHLQHVLSEYQVGCRSQN